MVKPLLASLIVLIPVFAAQSPVFKNDKVAVIEYRLMPSETANVAATHPAAIVYFDGHVDFKTSLTPIRNTGPAMLRFVEVQFLGAGAADTWGMTGLAPNYKILLENKYVRAYDIRIPAGGREPQHTHKNRVVICLSGAELKHIMPDGKEEPSTLKTGEIAWRPASTHIGVNLGKTNLWVIAVEPK